MTNSSEQSVHLVAWHMDMYLRIILISAFMLSVTVLKMCYLRMPIISNHVPESCILIIIGFWFGIIGRLCFNDIVKHLVLTPDIFFLMLLPPIVLESSYCLYTNTFADIIWIIAIFAILGTLFSFLIIGFMLYLLKEYGLLGVSFTLTLKPILLFAALIVAVDPVAVIAIFQDIGVDMELYFMVFGESLLNDAVTVVLYDIIKAFLKISHVKTVEIVIGIFSFFTVSLGGLVIGMIFGAISSFMVRFQSHYQYLILIIIGYISYIIALGVTWSGIISMIGCGIIQARYAFNNMTHDSVIMLRHVTETMASISEAMIFFYLGNAITQTSLVWNSGFALWALILCIISRLLMTVLLSALINYFNINYRHITLTEQFVLFYGGLRGAVSFSLCVLIHADVLDGDTTQEKERNRDMLFTTTMFIILFTVCVMGSTMKPLVKLLEIKMSSKNDGESKVLMVKLTLKALEFVKEGTIDISGNSGNRIWKSTFQEFDHRYVRPLLEGRKKYYASFLDNLVPVESSVLDKTFQSEYRPVMLDSSGRKTPLSILSTESEINLSRDFLLPTKSINIRNPREFMVAAQHRATVTQINKLKLKQSVMFKPSTLPVSIVNRNEMESSEMETDALNFKIQSMPPSKLLVPMKTNKMTIN